MEALQKTMLGCPGLRILEVSISRSGCMVGPTTIGDIDFSADSMTPSLEVIKFKGYALRRSWIDNMDWSRLRRLELTEFTQLERLAPHLSSLRAFAMRHHGYSLDPSKAQEIDGFLLKCALLEDLELVNLMEAIPITTVVRHGPELMRLKLHEFENFREGKRRIVLSLDSLMLLRESCPELDILEVDINRDGQWVRS